MATATEIINEKIREVEIEIERDYSLFNASFNEQVKKYCIERAHRNKFVLAELKSVAKKVQPKTLEERLSDLEQIVSTLKKETNV